MPSRVYFQILIKGSQISHESRREGTPDVTVNHRLFCEVPIPGTGPRKMVSTVIVSNSTCMYMTR